MKKIYKERLLKYADHLAGISNHPEAGLIKHALCIELKKGIEKEIEIAYQLWPFDELVSCFDTWSYDTWSGDPICEEANFEEGTLASVIDFFDLKLDEFTHIYGIGLQDIKCFGGGELTEVSNGPEIARNIIELISKKYHGI